MGCLVAQARRRSLSHSRALRQLILSSRSREGIASAGEGWQGWCEELTPQWVRWLVVLKVCGTRTSQPPAGTQDVELVGEHTEMEMPLLNQSPCIHVTLPPCLDKCTACTPQSVSV